MDTSTDLIATSVFLTACTAFLFYYFLLVLPKRRYESFPGPPIPSYLLGNMGELNRNTEVQPHLLLDYALKYGPAFRLTFPTGMIYVVTHPDDVRFVCTTRNYPKGTVFADYFNDFMPGLLTVETEEHPAMHSAISKHFNPHSLDGVASQMATEGVLLTSILDDAASEDRRINIDECFVSYLLDVLSLMTLGTRLGAQENYDGPFQRAFTNCAEELHKNLVWSPFRKALPGSQRFFRENMAYLREFTMSVIKDRSRPLSGNEKPRPFCLLDCFLNIPGTTMDKTFGHVMTFIFAGHDTTAHTMAFLVWECCRNPKIQARIAAEVDEVMGDMTGEFRMPDASKVGEMNYLYQVWQETLRLWPTAATGSTRRADRSDVLPHSGFPVEPGTHIMLPPYIAHRHPAYWDEPEKFDPERFSPKQMRSRRARDRSMIPFLTGPRKCIGNFFARFQAVLLLSLIFGRYTIELDCEPEEVVARQILTLKPRTYIQGEEIKGVPVKLRRRTFRA